MPPRNPIHPPESRDLQQRIRCLKEALPAAKSAAAARMLQQRIDQLDARRRALLEQSQ